MTVKEKIVSEQIRNLCSLFPKRETTFQNALKGTKFECKSFTELMESGIDLAELLDVISDDGGK